MQKFVTSADPIILFKKPKEIRIKLTAASGEITVQKD